MTDPTPQPPATGGHITPIQFWSAIIPLLAASFLLPAWQMYLQNRADIARMEISQQHEKELEALKEGQNQTHATLRQAVTRQEEIADKATEAAVKIEQVKQATTQISAALPPMPDKPAPFVE